MKQLWLHQVQQSIKNISKTLLLILIFLFMQFIFSFQAPTYATVHTTPMLETYQNDYERIYCLNQQNHRQAAILLAEKTLKEHPNYHDIRLLLAGMYTWNKQYPAAKRELIYLLQQDPEALSLDARLLLVDIDIWLKQYDEAIAITNEGLTRFPKNAALFRKKQLAVAALNKSGRKFNFSPSANTQPLKKSKKSNKPAFFRWARFSVLN